MAPRTRTAKVAAQESSQLSDQLETLRLTQEQFRLELETASRSTPRFLFRFWTAKSGGDPRLNTIDAITPKAFQHGEKTPEALHRMDPEDVASIALKHLTTEKRSFKTVFSSWSHSFWFVYSWAVTDFSTSKDVSIAVLDTSKTKNTALHSSSLRQALVNVDVEPGWDANDWAAEYLVFGKIMAPAFRSIKIQDLLQTRSKMLDVKTQKREERAHPEHLFASGTQQDRIDSVCRMAQLYGHDFEAVVVAHLMISAVRTQKEYEGFINTITSKFNLPESWLQDNRIMEGADLPFYGFVETAQAREMLKRMIIAKHGSEDQKRNARRLLQGRLRSLPELGVEEDLRRSKMATIPIARDPDVPQSVKKLYEDLIRDFRIRMRGFENQGDILARLPRH